MSDINACRYGIKFNALLFFYSKPTKISTYRNRGKIKPNSIQFNFSKFVLK